jgi:hypothetical protein
MEISIGVFNMLFLGAGASKVVGIDDLENLTTRIKQTLEQQGYGDHIQHIVGVEEANRHQRFFNGGIINADLPGNTAGVPRI